MSSSKRHTHISVLSSISGYVLDSACDPIRFIPYQSLAPFPSYLFLLLTPCQGYHPLPGLSQLCTNLITSICFLKINFYLAKIYSNLHKQTFYYFKSSSYNSLAQVLLPTLIGPTYIFSLMYVCNKTLLAFVLLYFVPQGQTCLLLQISLDFLLLHSSALWKKGHHFWC